MTNIRKYLYVTSMGIFFAILQTSYFFELEIWLTAAYPGFLTVMLGWLLGNLLGLYAGRTWVSARSPFTLLSISLFASVVAYYLCVSWLRANPYQMVYLPFYAIMIMVSGIQAGHFFSVNRSMFSSASTLFFLENNGFVIGWIIGFFGFIAYGSWFNIAAPAMIVVLLVLLSRPILRQAGSEP